MDIGDNLAAVLRDFTDQLYDLRISEGAAKDTLKKLKQDLKDEDIDPASVLALLKADDEKDEKKRKSLIKAGALLGKTVYTGEVDTTGMAEEYGEEVKEYVEAKVDAIKDVNADLEGLKTKIKALHATIKKEGFAPSVIEQIVSFRIDPDRRNQQVEFTKLYDSYVKAIGGTDTAHTAP